MFLSPSNSLPAATSYHPFPPHPNPMAPLYDCSSTEADRLPLGMYIGGFAQSVDPTFLAKHNIGAILSVVNPPANDDDRHLWDRPAIRALVPKNRHMTVHLRDQPSWDFISRMPAICEFLDLMRMQPVKILVHCTMGFSRSATAIMAYNMRQFGNPAPYALAWLRRYHPKANPNHGFRYQLALWGSLGCELWEDAAKTIPKGPYAEYLKEPKRQDCDDGVRAGGEMGKFRQKLSSDLLDDEGEAWDSGLPCDRWLGPRQRFDSFGL